MQQTYLDSLTDCYNRRFLPYWIDNEIKRSKRFTTKFGLIFLDIDDFRDINNAYGHSEGDNVLMGFAQFIHQNIRKIDSLVRYGGDAFVILVPNTTTKGTADLAHRIYDNLQTVEITHHKITCSIGFAIFPDNGTTVDALISYAENLMYQAKQQGKNRIALKKEIIKKLRIPSPKIVGREADVQWCLNQLREYDTILIGGEAGIGKTRLLRELPGQLKNSYILNSKAFAALSCVSYHLFRNMFQELMERDAGLVQRILNQMPVVYQGEVAKLLPAEQMARVAKTTELDKYRLYSAVSKFLRNIADSMSSTPVVLLMDDLHWMDRPSCEFFDFFIRSLDRHMKVVGTYRTEEIRHSEFSNFWRMWAREKLYTHTTLSPLDEAQTTHLLKMMMGMVPRKAAAFVYQQSGGNPFYIEEILRELDQKKKIYWNGKEWVFVKELAVAIPSSI
ncbi:MAG: diguanylate cyclase, partial [candidate division WOR-3 bacterium]